MSKKLQIKRSPIYTLVCSRYKAISSSVSIYTREIPGMYIIEIYDVPPDKVEKIRKQVMDLSVKLKQEGLLTEVTVRTHHITRRSKKVKCPSALRIQHKQATKKGKKNEQ